MGQADYLDLGDYNACCYECGRKFKASQLKRYWKGYYVCPEHWEPRQPQDFVKGVPDIQTPPWVQDRTDTFLEYFPASFCTAITVQPLADFGVSDCMTLGGGFPQAAVTSSSHAPSLLQESGGYILLEDNSGVILLG